jgi:hypothetical protein
LPSHKEEARPVRLDTHVIEAVIAKNSSDVIAARQRVQAARDANISPDYADLRLIQLAENPPGLPWTYFLKVFLGLVASAIIGFSLCFLFLYLLS